MNLALRRSAVAVMIAGLLLVQTGCTRHVRITSDPMGAKLSIDGNYAGATPYEFDSGMGPFFIAHELRAEMSGYETGTKTVWKNQPHWPGFIASLIFIWPVALFTWNYPETMSVTLHKR